MQEGFTASDALQALRIGEIIERRDDERRCLICGIALRIEERSDFIGKYIHCVVQWNQVEKYHHSHDVSADK